MSAFHFETYFTRTILNLLTDDNKQYCNPLVHCSNCFLNPIQDKFQTLLLVTKHEFHIKLKTKHGKVDMTECLKLKKKELQARTNMFFMAKSVMILSYIFHCQRSKVSDEGICDIFYLKGSMHIIILCILSYYHVLCQTLGKFVFFMIKLHPIHLK